MDLVRDFEALQASKGPINTPSTRSKGVTKSPSTGLPLVAPIKPSQALILRRPRGRPPNKPSSSPSQALVLQRPRGRPRKDIKEMEQRGRYFSFNLFNMKMTTKMK